MPSPQTRHPRLLPYSPASPRANPACFTNGWEDGHARGRSFSRVVPGRRGRLAAYGSGLAYKTGTGVGIFRVLPRPGRLGTLGPPLLIDRLVFGGRSATRVGGAGTSDVYALARPHELRSDPVAHVQELGANASGHVSIGKDQLGRRALAIAREAGVEVGEPEKLKVHYLG